MLALADGTQSISARFSLPCSRLTEVVCLADAVASTAEAAARPLLPAVKLGATRDMREAEWEPKPPSSSLEQGRAKLERRGWISPIGHKGTEAQKQRAYRLAVGNAVAKAMFQPAPKHARTIISDRPPSPAGSHALPPLGSWDVGDQPDWDAAGGLGEWQSPTSPMGSPRSVEAAEAVELSVWGQ